MPARTAAFGLWAAATLWLIAHAHFYLWESCRRYLLSIGNSPKFPAVSLPAIIEAVLTLWAINHSGAERAASA